MGNSLSEIYSVSDKVSNEVSKEILDTIIEEVVKNENDALVAGVYTKVPPEKRIKQLEDDLFNLEEKYNELYHNYTRLSLKYNETKLNVTNL